MAGKRRWGRLRQLPSGRWQARYPGPDATLHPAPDTFPTKTDGELWLVDKEAEIRRNGWHDPNAGRVRLNDFARQWLADRPDLAPRTAQRYEGLLRLHIAPHLGGYELTGITLAVVRTWRAQLLGAGVGEVTVAKSYRFLKTLLNTAVDDELIPRNPCRIKGAASETRQPRSVPSMPQVVKLADVIGDRWRALVLVAAFGALRWGELAALHRRDINLSAMTVRVERSLVELRGHLIEAGPKSDAGRRTVHLPEALRPVLRHHLTEFAEPGRDGRVFIGARGGSLRRPRFQATWAKATNAAELTGLRFHDLRHAGATWAAQAGATVRELQERLGHASPAAAMIYQHSVDERARQLAERLNERLGDVDQGAREGHAGGSSEEEE